jgi:prepilin-type N-terminal cleavage/methylation domain-containing protein
MRKMRRGYSLIEMLVVIAITGTTLTIVALIMHTLYQADRRLREDLEEQRNLQRIASQLRTDAHQAISVATSKVAENPLARVLTLSFSDNRIIEYSLAGKGVDRIVKRGSEVVHRDRFQFASASGSFWIMDATREQPLIALHLLDRLSADGSRQSEHEVTVIQATVGLTNASISLAQRSARGSRAIQLHASRVH